MTFASSSTSAVRGAIRRAGGNRTSAARQYASAALASEASSSSLPPSSAPESGAIPTSSSARTPGRQPNPSSSPKTGTGSFGRSTSLTPSRAQSYLSDLLHLPPTQQFSPDIAMQTLTHKSFRYAHLVRYPSTSDLEDTSPGSSAQPSSVPHNSRFSFLGRRALAAYLALFVHSHIQSSAGLRNVDFLRGKRLEEKLEGMRHASNLGREVGERWGVGEVVRWDGNENNSTGGSLRIKGLTVEAILGAVFSTHGSPAAQRAFYLHVLPHLSTQLRDPVLIERAQTAKRDVEQETGGGVLLP